jgi:hypothetical protein
MVSPFSKVFPEGDSLLRPGGSLNPYYEDLQCLLESAICTSNGIHY